MDSEEETGVKRSDRISMRRYCSHPEEIKVGNVTNRKKRKVVDPLLILVQEEAIRQREVGRNVCLKELAEQYESVLCLKNTPENKDTVDHKRTKTKKQKNVKQSSESLSLEYLNKQLNKIFTK